MCPTCILRPTKIIIKGAESKIEVCSVIKKKKKKKKKKKRKEKKRKEKKRKNNQKISTRFRYQHK